ncbi:MAG: molybdate ABC transporter substrate-binding protein [Caulobacteraceae bacterium]|nr:molybdate ABC transporter substrate-binding protein [Caulobacteraceae bacterium]
MFQFLRRRLVLGLTSLALTLGGPPLTAQQAAAQTAAAPVTVFAAASLRNAMDEVGKAYAAKTGKMVRFSYAASSAIARQIEQKAPADLFISADSDWMDYVQQRHLIVPESRSDLLTNHLALIAPAASPVKLRIAKGMPLAKALGGGRLSVAGPDVPAGKYGKAALTALGVWDSVSGHLAQAENVRGALAFVAQGEAPLGIVYDTDAKVEPKVRIVGLFPENTHPRIVYPAALTAYGANPDAIRVLAFLNGPEAGQIFTRFGFTLLPRPAR